METVTASSPQINFAAPGTVTAAQTTTVSHPTAVNLITQDQSKGLTYIVDPSQAQHIQMFAPDQRFVANSVEYNPVTGTLTTSAIPNGNPQLTVVSTNVVILSIISVNVYPNIYILNSKVSVTKARMRQLRNDHSLSSSSLRTYISARNGYVLNSTAPNSQTLCFY